MKHYRTLLAAVVLLAIAMPSIAAAQYYHEERLDHFISQRPEMREQLARNPNLIYNKAWRQKHPDLQSFMDNHPQIWSKLPNSERWGAYGPDHSWHESDWWHDHDRTWMWTHHPEWAENHPDWKGDGDFDDHHEWHDRDWWHDHHPDWADKHHPDWYKHPYEHPIAAEEHKHEHETVETSESKHGHHGNNGNGNNGKHDHN